MNDALVEPSGDSLTSAGLSFVAKILIILIWGLSHIHWFVTKIGLLPRFSLLLFSSASHLIINFPMLSYSHLLTTSAMATSYKTKKTRGAVLGLATLQEVAVACPIA